MIHLNRVFLLNYIRRHSYYYLHIPDRINLDVKLYLTYIFVYSKYSGEKILIGKLTDCTKREKIAAEC